MQQELASIVGRKVDPVSKRGSERSQNWIRRREINLILLTQIIDKYRSFVS